jgi:hypothetical protein
MTGKIVARATAKIDNDSVVVSAAGVTDPALVRYAWNRWPQGCSHYNRDGHAAAPFRSDVPVLP